MTPDPLSPSRWRGKVRTVLGLAFIVVPALVILGLAVVWVRSYQVEEQFTLERNHATFDPATNRITWDQVLLKVETARGVLGFYWRHDQSNRVATSPADVARVRESRAKSGWSFERVDTKRLDGSSGRYLPLQRDRDVIEPTRTCHRERQYTVSNYSDGSIRIIDRSQWVAPCWIWMLPLIGSPIWWLGCPAGRAIPRLTIGRTLAVTALIALVLAALTAFGRSAAADRALAILADHGSLWFYTPDPGGSGRPVITTIAIGVRSALVTTDADLPKLAAMLGHFPHLRSLSVYSDAITAAGFAALVVDLPRLEDLSFPGSAANNATLAHLRGLPKLRKLHLSNSKITDAGLVHLAGHPTLDVLELDNLGLSDAALPHLAGLPRLKQLSLIDTRSATQSGSPTLITDAALLRLADTLPALEFIRAPNGDKVSRGKIDRTRAVIRH